MRSSSYLDVVESHPEWLGAPFIEEAECLRDTNETAWRWGGTWARLPARVVPCSTTCTTRACRIPAFAASRGLIFAKTFLGAMKAGLNLSLSQKGLCLSPVHIAVRVYPPSAPPPIGKAPSQILHAL